jgi:hypothetical protein
MSQASMAPNRALPISGLTPRLLLGVHTHPKDGGHHALRPSPNANLILTRPPLVLTALDGVAKRLV